MTASAASSPQKTLPLVLVDGSSYLYRAFHAMFKADLRTSSGQPTGAVRGVVNMLKRLQKDYPGSCITVIFDAKGKTFRDDLYAEYKAHRPPMPDDLRSQIEPTYNIIRAMGFPLIVIEGVEADDVIGTFAQQATEANQPVIVSTGDKDMAQLVNPMITLVNTMTETVLDREGVIDKFGLPPELIIDYLALMGDKSDNIPGVPGVGEKTARGILQALGNLETVYENLAAVAELEIRGAKKLPDKLAEHRDKAFLSYQLATIKTDVDMELGIGDLSASEPDQALLKKYFTDLEFKSWLGELEGTGGAEIETPKLQAPTVDRIDYTTVFDQAVLDQWIAKLRQAKLFAFDTETNSLDYMQADIVGVSFSTHSGEGVYIPLAHDYVGAPAQLDRDTVLDQLKPLLEDSSLKKIGQHLKYDRNVLLNYGIELQGITFDTMLESYVFNSTATHHDMDSLAELYLELKTVHFEDIAGKGVKQLTFNQIDLEQASHYAAEDADITYRLHDTFWPHLEKTKALASVLTEIEIPLVNVLSRMERHGALIDVEALGKQSAEIGQSLIKIEKEAYQLAGEEFNLGSPKQLGKILFEKLGLPIIKKTPKKVPSTSEEVLQELALDYPLPEVIMQHRGLSKLKSTYTDKLPKMVNPSTGRVHTSYHQAIAATGRLSSSDPNLQNIPIRTEEGRRVRKAFIAPKGWTIIAADYSQIELRIMAHLSGDKGLLTAFEKGLDVHRATAAEVFGMALDTVTPEQRRSAKAINFGLIYGMSAFGLAKQLRIGRRDAQQYINLYFERYPGVQKYMDETRKTAYDQGYVETIFGRRLYLPGINDRNAMRRQAAERMAINAPMQGSAADIIKKAMFAVDQWIINDKVPAHIIMQVHDELVLEVKNEVVDEVQAKLSQLMSNAVQLRVPLVVDAGTGKNWDEAH